jgi:hypothetical protein
METVIGIGWDVGGWHGTGNAVVVLRWTEGRVERIGAGCERLPRSVPTLADFVAHFCESAAAEAVVASDSVVVGIDAPLGLPTDFRSLVAGDVVGGADPEAPFLENRLAFRETDRAIARRFPSKAPLSASFDKLGNPATVAMVYANAWTRGAGPRVRREAASGGELPAVLEVYPALSKRLPTRASAARPSYAEHLSGLAPDTHLYDAAISAVLALGWACGDDVSLPRLSVTESDPGEGAIWFPTHTDWTLPPRAQVGR